MLLLPPFWIHTCVKGRSFSVPGFTKSFPLQSFNSCFQPVTCSGVRHFWFLLGISTPLSFFKLSSQTLSVFKWSWIILFFRSFVPSTNFWLNNDSFSAANSFFLISSLSFSSLAFCSSSSDLALSLAFSALSSAFVSLTSLAKDDKFIVGKGTGNEVVRIFCPYKV